MGFSLIPKEMKFFDLFNQTTDLISSAAAKFVAMVTTFDDLGRRGQEIKNDELACDRLVENTIEALDRSFITPFDREDIHALVTNLDRVMDALEDTAHRFEVFRLPQPTPEAVRLARIVQESCTHMENAVKLLSDLQRPEQINNHLREIGRLEKEADRVYRAADADLLDNANGDLLTLIKWRELYAWLEQTVDATKDVGLIISEIVIKGT